jgi:hypothetical protein
MAERDRLVAQASDSSGGTFRLIAVVEDTQSTTDPRGRPSHTVVSVKLTNTSTQRGQATWQSSNGKWNTNTVLPAENSETRIAPSRREFFHIWASRANATWG